MALHAREVQLEEYVSGMLSSDTRDEIEAHLDQCHDCRLRMIEMVKAALLKQLG